MISNALELVHAAAEPAPNKSSMLSLLRLGCAYVDNEIDFNDLAFEAHGYNVDFFETYDDSTIVFELQPINGDVKRGGYIQFFPGLGDLKRGIRKQAPTLELFDASNDEKLYTYNAKAMDRFLSTKRASTEAQFTQVLQNMLKSMLSQAEKVLGKQVIAAAEPEPEPFGYEQVEEELQARKKKIIDPSFRVDGVSIGYSRKLDESHRVFFTTRVPGCELGFITDAGDGHRVTVTVNNVFRTTIRIISLQDLAQNVAKLTKAHARRPRQ